ncbi:unnamed protein product [Phytophthora lilii]|uniref:Unnamed protein product n=1 Tax=Phytophthora lilii TaxID=2077276 RepID=A0A9W6U6G2_9STRA|nr:unnamed protein product [Phytophthora lilii]
MPDTSWLHFSISLVFRRARSSLRCNTMVRFIVVDVSTLADCVDSLQLPDLGRRSDVEVSPLDVELLEQFLSRSEGSASSANDSTSPNDFKTHGWTGVRSEPALMDCLDMVQRVLTEGTMAREIWTSLICANEGGNDNNTQDCDE